MLCFGICYDVELLVFWWLCGYVELSDVETQRGLGTQQALLAKFKSCFHYIIFIISYNPLL
jgi:hypothetical protein